MQQEFGPNLTPSLFVVPNWTFHTQLVHNVQPIVPAVVYWIYLIILSERLFSFGKNKQGYQGTI